MDESIDFNNLELEIKKLYKSLEIDFKQPNTPKIVIKETISNVGKTTEIRQAFGVDKTTDDEILDILNKVDLIIGSLAKLRDKLLGYFKNREIDCSIISEKIKFSLHIKVLLDLNNGSKHIYPTDSNRSKKHPKFTNFKYSYEFNMIGNLWYNLLQNNGTVFISADIVNKEDEFLFTFKELVEASLKFWEDLIFEYLPEVAEDIKLRKKKEEEIKFLINKLQNLANLGQEILKDSKWKYLLWSQIECGTIVQCTFITNVEQIISGVVDRTYMNEKNEPIVTLITDSPFIIENFVADKCNWKILNETKFNDGAVLLHYFLNVPILRDDLSQLENKNIIRNIINPYNKKTFI